MVEVKWAPVIKGIIIAVILALLIHLINAGSLDFIAIILATIYVGYEIGADYKNGAIYGALVGIVSGIIILIIVLTGYMAMVGALFFEVIALSLILSILFAGTCGVIGGVVGVLLKNKTSKKKVNICPMCGAENEPSDLVCSVCDYNLVNFDVRESYPESHPESRPVETKTYGLWVRVISILFGILYTSFLISFLNVGNRLLEANYSLIAYTDILIGLIGLFLILIGVIPNIISRILRIDTTTKFRAIVLILIIIPFIILMIEPEPPEWYYMELIALMI
jgi:hypothetical protein